MADELEYVAYKKAKALEREKAKEEALSGIESTGELHVKRTRTGLGRAVDIGESAVKSGTRTASFISNMVGGMARKPAKSMGEEGGLGGIDPGDIFGPRRKEGRAAFGEQPFDIPDPFSEHPLMKQDKSKGKHSVDPFDIADPFSMGSRSQRQSRPRKPKRKSGEIHIHIHR